MENLQSLKKESEQDHLVSYHTFHLFLRIGLNQIPLSNEIEGLDDLSCEKIPVLVNDFKISYDIIFSPDLFFSNGMQDLI
jgi:hypothetical protein